MLTDCAVVIISEIRSVRYDAYMPLSPAGIFQNIKCIGLGAMNPGTHVMHCGFIFILLECSFLQVQSQMTDDPDNRRPRWPNFKHSEEFTL